MTQVSQGNMHSPFPAQRWRSRTGFCWYNAMGSSGAERQVCCWTAAQQQWEETQAHPGPDPQSPLIEGSRWQTGQRERAWEVMLEGRGVSGGTSPDPLQKPATLPQKGLFISWEQFAVQCQMLIFSIAQIIFPVLKSLQH